MTDLHLSNLYQISLVINMNADINDIFLITDHSWHNMNWLFKYLNNQMIDAMIRNYSR